MSVLWQVVSGLCYVSTYEGVRHVLDSHGVQDTKVKALVGQTISQHLMVLGTQASKKGTDLAANPLAVPTEVRSKAQVAMDVTRQFHIFILILIVIFYFFLRSNICLFTRSGRYR